MKKAVAFIVSIALMLTLISGTVFSFASQDAAEPAKNVVSVSDDGLHIKVDFSAMEPTDRMLGEITAEEIGAIDIDINYQILNNGEDGKVLCTVNGFEPAWIIYEVNAPSGQVLDTLKLTITGRICDFSPIANAFAVFALEEGFTGEGENCELNRIPADQRAPEDWEDYAYYVMQANHGTMPTSDSVTTVHEFDLTEVAKGCSSMYIGIYQYTTNCPEWIEYRSLSIDATASEKAPAKTQEPVATGEPEVTAEPVATDAPAVTEKADPGKATEEPAKATEPKDDNDDDKKKSSSPVLPIVIGAVAVAAVAAAAIIIVKKKKK